MDLFRGKSRENKKSWENGKSQNKVYSTGIVIVLLHFLPLEVTLEEGKGIQ